MDDLLGLRHLQEQKYKKRLALGEDIQHLAKQKHNLTRIHTLGYIEEPQFIERSAAIEQQIRERKQQLSRNDMSNTSEKILQKTRLIQKKLSSTPPLELFDESVFKELVKKVLISNTAIQFELIFNSYLQGASLLTIKKKLEAGGVLTARGNKKWSSESVQRILQNEKYCGDVLLQKTFIEDVLTGVSKKNTGQLPQYYIENNHEGIVTKQMFREVQAEIARRNSKSAANQRKRHQGRYNSKYALSERLVCGDCGSPYKRVTWNIHGRKQIVWRCVNRLEYGTKFCSHSPSIPEEELHQAILKAVQNLAANFTDEVAAQLDGILRQMKAGENLKAQLQKQLEKAQQEFDRLLEMSLELDESTPFLDDKLRKLSGKIKILKANIAESTDGKGEDEEATKQLTAQDLLIKEYDDILTARIIEKVIVHSRQEIEIYFIGGYTQKIDLI